MDVVILCGGKGTRLSEETITKPKPMVEIGGVPILIHIMNIYSHYGYKRFILPLGYKSEYIKKYFHNYKLMKSDMQINLNSDIPVKYFNNNCDKDWEIILIDTGLDTLKNERLRKVGKYINSDSFHLTYGDGVSDINIDKLVKFHNSHTKMGTVTAVHPPSRFGKLDLDGDDVKKFDEKAQMTDEFINGGFFIFDRDILCELDDDKDFEFGTLNKIVANNQLKAYKHTGFWQCMDSVRERDYLNELVSLNKALWIKEKYNV